MRGRDVDPLNKYRATSVNGGPGPGLRTRPGPCRHGAISAKTLPAGYTYEWTGTGAGADEAARAHQIVLALAFCSPICSSSGSMRAGLFPYRFSCPVVSRRSARSARSWPRPELRHLCPDRPRRAHRTSRKERHPDRRVRGGAAQPGDTSTVRGRSGRLRFRPVMMTSFAFIFGLVPLVFAGAGRRRASMPSACRVRGHDRRVCLRHLPHSDALHHRGTSAPTDADKAGPGEFRQLECSPRAGLLAKADFNASWAAALSC